MKKILLLVICYLLLTFARANALPVSHTLPLDLSAEAAMEAVKSCQKQGYNVTATVVTKEGVRQVIMRGDGATPHTIENSFNKAYTAITLGPVQKVDSTSAIVKSMSPSPNPIGNWPMPPSSLPGVTFVPGGLSIKVGDELIGGLGVSGAPGG